MASGDLTYNEQVNGELTAGQRTALAAIINALWDGPLAGLQKASFVRQEDGTISYTLRGSQTKPPSQIPLNCVVTARVP